VRDFRKLTVWTKAHELTLQIYRVTAHFPKEEMYGITSQMRRCSASIPANIAEGCGRSGDGDFHRFLSIAAGSSVELEYFLLLAHDLGFIDGEVHEATNRNIVEVQKMLAGLSRTVKEARRRPGT
jgi:four helix bundle protein